jgi:pyruvate/2-oxoglutarate dehydrogenase complex dihydrolipoamide dehydrogenase (E3) component
MDAHPGEAMLQTAADLRRHQRRQYAGGVINHRYGAAQSQLRDARRVLIVGGGLIGCELAMDFCRAGKAVRYAQALPAAFLTSDGRPSR